MNSSSENRIEELARQKMAGKSYSTIRKELSESGMTAGEINDLIREVDERVLSETVKQGKPDRSRQWYRFGFILALIGQVLSIALNAGLLFENLPALLIYSPFFAGILVMAYGKLLQRKQSAPADPGTGAIRRKRPYK